ncbi:MAG: F0F1 ATP synthase subunit A [Lachnospiraceae bacterium]|nr:F0F1 ATP synthase subunit A [Lachnospiraceae bacterium]
MDNLTETLMEEMNVQTVFTIPLFGGIPVSESVVVTWIIMAAMILFAFVMTRGLRVNKISKRQAFLEWMVTKLDSIVGGMLGGKAKVFGEYLITILLYIGLANIIGIFGFKSPTKDLNVTIALALMSILLVEAAGVYYLGIRKHLHKFIEPTPVILPINILEVVTKPLSLCMRLFGNVIGAFVIMKLLEIVIPIGIPVVFSLYFDFFDGILQAYVFVFLTGMYLTEAVE